MSGPDNAPHNALRYHVTGAIERGDAEPVSELSARDMDAPSFADYLDMVGNGYAESGASATAEDCHKAAAALREVIAERDTLRGQIEHARRALIGIGIGEKS